MSLIAQLPQFATETQTVGAATLQYRRARSKGAANAVTHVLLHGIGSASGSWLAQLQQVQGARAPASHVLAWDAPGYGASTALTMDAPVAADYALRMWLWLDALGAQAAGPLTLVGHSLGALMAAAAAAMAPGRVTRLILLAPAQGHARVDAAERERKLADRLANLAALGPAGMAHTRASAMLSARASADQLAFVEHVMAQVHPAGYTQAARLLSGGDLLADLLAVDCPVLVASGSADTITPAPGCQSLARQVDAPYVSLGPVGHSCALEGASRVNPLIGLEPTP
ncbi:MAG: alpha/beta hydrolase [Betaproteobacteria bacterium]